MAQRLHQIQGWQAAVNVILTIGKTPEEVRQIVESYRNET